MFSWENATSSLCGPHASGKQGGENLAYNLVDLDRMTGPVKQGASAAISGQTSNAAFAFERHHHPVVAPVDSSAGVLGIRPPDLSESASSHRIQ